MDRKEIFPLFRSPVPYVPFSHFFGFVLFLGSCMCFFVFDLVNPVSVARFILNNQTCQGYKKNV